MNIKWDADSYSSTYRYLSNYGENVLSLVNPKSTNLKGVDVGCGVGNLTKKLNDLGISTIGIDDSEEMVKVARNNYPDLTFKRENALTFQLEEPVDLIFSNAVFHWINKEDQEDLIKNLNSNLKSGGELIFEFGSVDCFKTVHSVLRKEFEKLGYTYRFPFYYPSISEYSTLLENNGFRVTFAQYYSRMTELENSGGMDSWIKHFLKAPFENIPPEDVNKIIKSSVDQLRKSLFINSKWYLDFTRIRMKAIKL